MPRQDFSTWQARADADREHRRLQSLCRRLPTDYTDYGGTVVRWADLDEAYPDCSSGCRWALWLEGALVGDWCVCTKPDGPRAGLLTFERQAGSQCFEPAERKGKANG